MRKAFGVISVARCRFPRCQATRMRASASAALISVSGSGAARTSTTRPSSSLQGVAAAQHRRLRQVEQEGEAADAGHDETAAVALVELEHDAIGRRSLPRPRGKNPVRPQHRQSPPQGPARPWTSRETNASRPVSRVLYGRGSSPRRDGHSSGTPVAGRLEQPTRATEPTDKAPRTNPRVAPIRFCSRRGLPCRRRCRLRGALLPHPFTLTRWPFSRCGRFTFCGAFPGVAPAGRYPAPRPFGARTFLRSRAAAVQPTGANRG